MNNKIITEQEVYAAIGKHLLGELCDGIPEGEYGYMSSEYDDQIWHAYINSNGGRIGASQFIFISKTARKVLGHRWVGE